MTLVGGMVGVGMFGTPVAGYFLLRLGGRRVLGALGGAFLIWAGCMLVALVIAWSAAQHGVSLNIAMWFYLPAIILIALSMWRRYVTKGTGR